jgi:lactoylglutathione lyase
MQLKIYSDGGARGNPGPAALAYVILAENHVLKSDSRFLGVKTNNQAEYEALIAALQCAITLNPESIICHLDSELVTKQLTGEYSVKNPELKLYWQKTRKLLVGFKKSSFIHVPRTNVWIGKADALVNKTLDEQKGNCKVSVTEPLIGQSNLNSNVGTLFNHVSIRASNLEKSIDFYSRFLGLTVLSRREIKRTNAEIVFLGDLSGKGCRLELTHYRGQKEFVQGEYEERLFDHLGFDVPSIDATLAAMKKEGVVVTDEPFALDSSITIAFVEDPDGTIIELVERK